MTDDIIDRIDALVDEQLANYDNRSGYDHNINQDRCRCGRDWHGLPITKHIDRMRALGRFDSQYSYDTDESTVMCVGSNTPGPWRESLVYDGIWQLPDDPFDMTGWETLRATLTEARSTERFRIADGRPYMVGEDFRLAEGERVGWDNGAGVVHVGRVQSREPDGRGGWTITIGEDPHTAMPSVREAIHTAITMFGDLAQAVATGMESVRAGLANLGAQLDDPDTRTPQQRALPQPSTTPPFWAADVNRTRRPRRHHNQPNKQGTR
ncbi:hypothetical protein ACFULT_26430 [Rhodococcus sp. NPDC057297]|uniref:hypothetical protein n=1 Tax=Rhodococcus sp. NPDC057297 TaxID=3346090 RepID=UPI0036277C3F